MPVNVALELTLLLSILPLDVDGTFRMHLTTDENVKIDVPEWAIPWLRQTMLAASAMLLNQLSPEEWVDRLTLARYSGTLYEGLQLRITKSSDLQREKGLWKGWPVF